MSNSYCTLEEFHCLTCFQHFSVEVWLIIDANERQDLLDKIKQGTLHEISCPNCGPIGQKDSPLLVFHSSVEPPMLFSPSRYGTNEDNVQAEKELVKRLGDSLGIDPQDNRLSGVMYVDRSVLPNLVSDQLDKYQEPKEQAAIQLPPGLHEVIEELRQSGVEIHSVEDLQRALDDRPNLRERFEAIARNMEESSDGGNPHILNSPSDLQPPKEVIRIITEGGQLGKALHECLNVHSLEEYRTLLSIHPELYAEEGLELLQRLLAAESRMQARPLLEFFIKVNRRCQKVGLEQAFSEITQQPVATSAEFMDDIQMAEQSMQHFLETGSDESLSSAVDTWKRILSYPELRQTTHRFQASLCNDAGKVFLHRYWRMGAIQDLKFAQDLWMQAIELTPMGSPERALYLSNLGNALRDLYAHTGQLEALEEAIQVYEQAVELTSAHSPELSRYLNNLGNGLRDRYGYTGQLEDLEKAIKVLRQSVALISIDSLELAPGLNNLAIGLYDHYAHLGLQEDLEEAIQLWQETLDLTPKDNYTYPRCLSNLGTGLQKLYDRTGQLEVLEKAIWVHQQALVSTPSDSPDYPSRLNNLGNSLHGRFTRTGQLEDLEQAILVYREAMRLTPSHSIQLASHLTNLGNGLRDRYARAGRLEDLEESIRVSRQALTLTSIDSPSRPMYLNNLGGSLLEHYARSGRLEEVEEAILIYQEALDLGLVDSPNRPGYLNNLAASLSERYTRTGQLEDLEQAILVYREAVRLTPPDSIQLALHLNNLGFGLRDRYARAGRLEDLEESIRVSRQALTLTSMDSPSRPMYLNSLSISLHDLYRHSGRLGDLDEAIQISRQAVQLISEDALDRSGYLNNLAIALRDYYARTGLLEDLDEAKCMFQEACKVAEACSDQILLISSMAWGDWAFERKAWDEAIDAYTLGLKASRNLYNVQFSRTGKESFMRDARGLTSRAAFAFIKKGDIDAAVEILESGRARLLGEALERTRRDLEALSDPAIGKKDLLERYRIVSERYNALQNMNSKSERLVENATVPPPNWLQQLDEAQADIDQVIDEIRKVPGYETFLLSPSAVQIQQNISDAPIVYLAVTVAGGIGLVVTRHDLEAIELPNLTEDMLHKHVIGEEGQAAYLPAYLAWRSDPHNNLRLETWKSALEKTTQWLWNVCMQTLIQRLKSILSPGAQVILIPSDWLSLLPLHAAWTSDQSRPSGRLYAIDEFTFTYAPNVLSLVRISHQNPETQAEKLLVVENPDQSLQFSEYAAQAALRLFDKKSHLSGHQATLDAVKKAFKEHSVLYFFTHGVAWFDEPLQSALTLADRPLTLGDIFNLKIDHARLAVLSACETGLPSNLDLLDEAISLPTGLIQAGVPAVIGSLWTVFEVSTAILMTMFFAQWCRVEHSAPKALRMAQMMLRDAANNKIARNYFHEASVAENIGDTLLKQLLLNDFDHPFYWAAFTYTGM